MENEHLRTAIKGAGLTLEEFAGIVQVDVKTVQRWLAGRTPYPRHRARVAGALDTTEHALWPDTVPAPPASGAQQAPTPVAGDAIAGYGQATDPAAPTAAELLGAAVERIEIAIPNLASERDLVELVSTGGINGCRVRIIIKERDEQIGPLLGVDAIEVRVSPRGEDHVLYRADDELLLLLTRIRSEGASPPMIYLRRQADGGLFDRLTDDFDDRWLEASPITSREQLHSYPADTELERRARPAHPPETDPPPPQPTSASPADAPRRWPRRPT